MKKHEAKITTRTMDSKHYNKNELDTLSIPLEKEKIERIVNYPDNIRDSALINYVEETTREFKRTLNNYLENYKNFINNGKVSVNESIR